MPATRPAIFAGLRPPLSENECYGSNERRGKWTHLR